MASTARLLAAVLAIAACACLPAAVAFDVPTVAFDEGFSPLFGDGNLVRAADGRTARLLLDRRSGNPSIPSIPETPFRSFTTRWRRFLLRRTDVSPAFALRFFFSLPDVTTGPCLIPLPCFFYLHTGSGFISSDYYLHGFFSASIKLPRDYTAGVVVAFYVSAFSNPPRISSSFAAAPSFQPLGLCSVNGHMACRIYPPTTIAHLKEEKPWLLACPMPWLAGCGGAGRGRAGNRACHMGLLVFGLWWPQKAAPPAPPE
jgi:hypothetical protein